MKKAFFLCLCFGLMTTIIAQKQTVDLVTYSAPKGWKKEIIANTGVKFTSTKGNSYCILGIYNSSNSEGTLETDFNSEWEELVVKNLNPDSVANKQKGETINGFENMIGVGTFTLDDAQSLAMLSVYSGHGKRTSILALSNDEGYLKELDIFIASISIKKPDNKIVTGNNDKVSTVPAQLIQSDWKQTSNRKDNLNSFAGFSTNKYEFRSNNTYKFTRVDFQSYTPKFYLEDETGTYKVNGNRITITPSKSYFHVHQRQTSDPPIKTGNLSLQTVQYTFEFTIVNETETLLLAPVDGKESRRDGVFSFWRNGQPTKSYIYNAAVKK